MASRSTILLVAVAFVVGFLLRWTIAPLVAPEAAPALPTRDNSNDGLMAIANTLQHMASVQDSKQPKEEVVVELEGAKELAMELQNIRKALEKYSRDHVANAAPAAAAQPHGGSPTGKEQTKASHYIRSLGSTKCVDANNKNFVKLYMCNGGAYYGPTRACLYPFDCFISSFESVFVTYPFIFLHS
jgi:hypothetical protein